MDRTSALHNEAFYGWDPQQDGNFACDSYHHIKSSTDEHAFIFFTITQI